jgi:hypothetical protein
MEVKQWTKLVCLVMVITATAVLGFYDKLAPEAVAGIISACLGYVFGNGHAILEQKTANQRWEE